MKFKHTLSFIALLFIINSCATYKAQYADDVIQQSPPQKEVKHTFYLLGDAGNSDLGDSSKAIKAFKSGKSVRRDQLVGMADMGLPVGIGNRGSDVEFFSHWWRRFRIGWLPIQATGSV